MSDNILQSPGNCNYWFAIRVTVDSESLFFGPYTFDEAHDRRNALLVMLRSPNSISTVALASSLPHAKQLCRFLPSRA